MDSSNNRSGLSQGLTDAFIRLGLIILLVVACVQVVQPFVGLILWALILATLLSFWRVHPLAGALLVPYLLWVSFAAALNNALWQLNPQILA